MLLVVVERGGDGAAPLPFLRVQRYHACHCLVQVVAVLLPEDPEESVEFILPQFVRLALIDRVAVFKGATGEYGESNAENFSEGRVDMGGIASLLDEVVVDFLRGQVDRLAVVVLVLE